MSTPIQTLIDIHDRLNDIYIKICEIRDRQDYVEALVQLIMPPLVDANDNFQTSPITINLIRSGTSGSGIADAYLTTTRAGIQAAYDAWINQLKVSAVAADPDSTKSDIVALDIKTRNRTHANALGVSFNNALIPLIHYESEFHKYLWSVTNALLGGSAVAPDELFTQATIPDLFDQGGNLDLSAAITLSNPDSLDAITEAETRANEILTAGLNVLNDLIAPRRPTPS